MANALDIRKLTKRYGDFCLDDVSLTLPAGYIMGLIGPNGAGKTTLIKSIMNLAVKDSGQIDVFGLDHLKHEIAVKERIGFVYENPGFYDHLTLKQHKRIIAPFYKRWDEAVFEDLVRRFDLPLDKTLRHFSRGMTAKAALALALSHHADLLILDEPTAGLDPVARRHFLDLLREIIQDEGKAVLFSTHITTDIEAIADYIAFIQDGHLQFCRSKDEVMEQFALIKGANELLDADTRGCFIGVRQNDYGFEALTDDIGRVKETFDGDVVIDPVRLEDIMYFSNPAALS